MPHPIAICLEDLRSHQFLRCVLLPGTEPGLGLDARGRLLWKDPSTPVELWVTADQRLALMRTEGAPEVEVHRGPRSVAAPVDKPVILLAGDEVHLGDRRLRLHVHGRAPREHAPEPLPAQRSSATRLATAALALGMAGCISVRAAPPKVAPPEEPQEEITPGPVAIPVTLKITGPLDVPVEGATLHVDGAQLLLDTEGKTTFSTLALLDGTQRANTPGLLLHVLVEAPGHIPLEGTVEVLPTETEATLVLEPEPVEVMEAPPKVAPVKPRREPSD